MTLLKRATDQEQQEWIPVPEGTWRWIIGEPEVKLSERFGNYQVRFPLQLTTEERSRLTTDYGQVPDGMQQSTRASYTTGLSLGYVKRDGQYSSTKLIDFLAAALGTENAKKFRDWISKGGGPPRPADKDDQKAELELIADWLKWLENLEVYGTISHADDSQVAGLKWARFAGPLPVGSLPGQRDPEYQAHGRGKLRAIILEAHPELAEAGKDATPAPVKPKRTYEEIFGTDAQADASASTTKAPVAAGDGSKDLPW